MNLLAMADWSEAESIKFFADYDLVFAVWINTDGAPGVMRIKNIQRPHVYRRWPWSKPESCLMMSAVPVADEPDARRWAALLSSGQAVEPAPGLRLVGGRDRGDFAR
jgi:hypothetical protein